MRGRFAIYMALLGLLVAGAFVGCSDDNGTSPQFGTMSIRMTDAPAGVEAVNLVINQVAAFRGTGTDADSVTGWEILRSDSMHVDLLTLRNGVFTQLALESVPAGQYSQLRLKLGAGSTIVIDGVTYPLVTPSALQSGLKLQGPFFVPPNGTTDLVLDFDASRSIVTTGVGTYLLKPVIRVMSSTAVGSITGRVLPTTVLTTVYAMQAADTVSSTLTAGDGRFTISVLATGTYSLNFDPEGAYRDTTITGVLVTSGQATDVGDVQLTAQ